MSFREPFHCSCIVSELCPRGSLFLTNSCLLSQPLLDTLILKYLTRKCGIYLRSRQDGLTEVWQNFYSIKSIYTNKLKINSDYWLYWWIKQKKTTKKNSIILDNERFVTSYIFLTYIFLKQCSLLSSGKLNWVARIR